MVSEDDLTGQALLPPRWIWIHKPQIQQSPDFRRGSVLKYGTGGRTWTATPEGNGFWIRRVYQFHHTGISRLSPFDGWHYTEAFDLRKQKNLK